MSKLCNTQAGAYFAELAIVRMHALMLIELKWCNQEGIASSTKITTEKLSSYAKLVNVAGTNEVTNYILLNADFRYSANAMYVFNYVPLQSRVLGALSLESYIV